MKTMFLLLLLISSSCTAIRPVSYSDDSILVKIECRNDVRLRQHILSQLRMVNARDVVVDEDGDFISIRGACHKQTTSPEKLADITRNIGRMPGVLAVLLENNTSVIRERV